MSNYSHPYRKTKKILLLGLLLPFFFFKLNAAQDKKIIDSLSSLLAKSTIDTVRIKLLTEMSYNYKRTYDYTNAVDDATQALDLCLKNGSKKRIANAYSNLGQIFQDMANYDSALDNYKKGLENYSEIKEEKEIAQSLTNIGIVNWYQGNYPEALKYYYKALTLKEKLGDKKGVAKTYGNIGLVLKDQGNYKEALAQYGKSLSINQELAKSSDKKIHHSAMMGVGNAYNNMAMIFRIQKKYDEALGNYTKSLEIFKEEKDLQGVGVCYNNMGNIFLSTGDYKKTLDYYSKAMKIREEMDDKEGLSSSYLNVGGLHYEMHQLQDARIYFNKALALSKILGNKNTIKESYFDLAEVDSVQGNYTSAFDNYKMYIAYRDSLNNELNTKRTVETQMQYAFDKKQAADSIRVAEEKKVVAAELKSEQRQRYSLYGGLGLTLVFAIFILNRFRVTRKQKIIIEGQKQILEYQKKIVEEQKHIVEEKNKDIMDSIHYARRIQRSLLPTEKYIVKNLNRLMRA